MFFNSIPFFLFFTLLYSIYWNVPFRFRHALLIFFGILFYAYNSIPFLIHFSLVISINYYLYKKIHDGKKVFVKLAVIFNLFNLGFFKYFYFFTKFLFDLTHYKFFEQASQGELFKIVLPLAISFYSFQMISFAIDTHREEVKSELVSYKNYFLYVLFFPVLVAGPIMRFKEFAPNLKITEPEKDKIYKACFLMMSGLVKKILIADPMSTIINPIFANPSEFNSITLFVSGILYTIQLYGDFSGLTDMARSIAYFVGFEIPENFFGPFFSTSVKEFWKRWHVTLSSWLMEYIYIPLGGSRLGVFRTYLNLIITMTLGGLWHGSDYTFLFWGFYLGAVLSIERIYEKWRGDRELSKNIFVLILKSFVVHILMAISVLMFRSNNTELMFDLFKGIFTNSSEFLRNILIASGDSWVLRGVELIQTEKSFLMSGFKNFESAVYMYIAFLIFHYFQYKPEFFKKFEKYKFPLVIVLGVITVFLLTTLSNEGDGFIYTTF